MAGICNDVRKSWHSEAQENGSGEVLPALSLRSAETGIYKKFLSNRSGTRPDGTPDAGISPVPQSPAAFAHHAPRASGFRPHLLPNMRKNFTIGLTKLLKHYKIEVL